MKMCGIRPPLMDLIWLIENSPVLRRTAFRELMFSDDPTEALKLILKILKKGTFVDDITYFDFANFCLHAQIPKNGKNVSNLHKSVKIMEDKGDIGKYSSLLIIGKIETSESIANYAEKTAPYWKNDFWLGRAIAGLYPRTKSGTQSNKISSDYVKLVESSNNPSAIKVINYHKSLMNDKTEVVRSKTYLSEANTTLPSKLFFPKALQILSVSQNVNSSGIYNSIKKGHTALNTDPFLKRWGF